MARLTKKQQREQKIKEEKIISGVLMVFSIYYFFISLRSSDPINSSNPLDSFGLVGGFFLRVFNQLFGEYDLLVIAFVVLFSGYLLVSKESVNKVKALAYFFIAPVLLGLFQIYGEGAGFIGYFFAFIYIKLFGRLAAYLTGFLTILLLVLYLTDFPFAYIFTKLKKLFTGFTSKKDVKVTKKSSPVKEKETETEKETGTSKKEALSLSADERKNIIPILNSMEFPAKRENQEEMPPSIAPAVNNVVSNVVSLAEKRAELEKKNGKNEKEEEQAEEVSEKLPQVTLEVTPSKTYDYPSLDILDNNDKDLKFDQDKINARAKILEETLENFGVKGQVSGVNCGPAITRYEFQPAPGIKVSKVVNLADDIALSLATSGVRIAPVAGKNVIGVEVPNKQNVTVGLRSVLDTQEFTKSKSKLSVALGKDIAGKPMIADLQKMPHLLVAGATGSGKSVCMNSIIASILFNASPDEVKMIMVDPKMVELTVYNGIPHLITPVVTDPKKAASALRWAVKEMENRYALFSAAGVKNIEVYNENVEESQEDLQKLPYIVVLIDELSDLMMVAPADVEDAITRIAQMARAAGIHLVIATQRPSVNVITGIIKANIPSRIAFAVSSQVDSRTILDMNGAEKLLGKGDMLYYPTGYPKPVRVQGVFVSDDEIENLVMEIKSKGVPKYNEEVINQLSESQDESQENEPQEDELMADAALLFIENGQASISLLQRRFRIGYNRAARIIDQMEQKGIIGGYEGSKPRQILINHDDYAEIFNKK